jgi:general nucleoside transport system ATP-binding protein
MNDEPDIAVRLRDITKRFGALLANDKISLTVRRREVVALLGENGAGKTTLMNILFGRYVADEGTVEVFGRQLTPGSTSAAIAAGIGMVHQHFTLAANLTVLENVEAGTESWLRPSLARRRSRKRLSDLSARFGLVVDPDALVGALTIGERQRVEILKALYREAQVLVLDEPTAVLTPQEASSLFATLRRMASDGLAVIFISHKLDEVRANADRILVLRAGAIVAERTSAATTRDELAELMVGRRVARPARNSFPPGMPLLEAEGVSLHDGRRVLLEGATFTIREREILGLVGVSGNGQGAIADLATGLAVPTSGHFVVVGKPISHADPRQLIAAGVARVPDDRHALGVVGDMSVWKNAIIEQVGTRRFSRFGMIRRNAARTYAQEIIQRYDIRGATLERRARLLSGGNLQKLILGRNLAISPRLIIANQPTRGLDEGAVVQVHARLLDAKSRGAGILLITEDLDEGIALADRIMAIHRGRLSPAIPAESATARGLGLMMAGHWEETSRAI